MDWEELFMISLGLSIIIAPPILFAWIFRWTWKWLRPRSELRRLYLYTASFAVWLLVIAGWMYPMMQMSPEIAGPIPMPAFPWPPPAASAQTVIPDKWLPTKGRDDLGKVAFELESALHESKYRKWSYSTVPNGFALVSQMEQIMADGTPSPEPARWSADLPSVANMTLIEFIRALVNAPPGYYRVIVFIVTNQPWPRTGEKPTDQEVEKWLAKGFNWLPPDVGLLPYGTDYRTTALVYEFKKVSKDANASLIEPSRDIGR